MNEFESAVSKLVEDQEDFCRSFVIPLLIPSTKSKRSVPEFVGTGFIIKYKSGEYLISANHVVEEFSNRKSAMYSFGPKTGTLFEIEPVEENFCSEGDIAVVKIESVEPQGLDPLSVAPQKLYEAKDNILHIWGYPGSRNKNIVSKKKTVPMGMTVKILADSIDRNGTSTVRNAILDRENFVESGMSAHPDGISGSPVFSLGAERAFTEPEREKEREFELVGVYTETDDQEKSCQYELLSFSLYACRDAYPDFVDWKEFQETVVY